ncbi:MAG: FkbM family methyltransferase [Clostridia bacterium]|nr:FkbM family methyltransferase [Clostridia bacterium]
MSIGYSELPQYPCMGDMWDSLKAQSRPIVIYGMGNGADKLIDRLSSIGVCPSGIFASDGFVRGQSFRGMTVRSLSDIKVEYPDPVILLSFGSRREDVLDLLTNIDKTEDLYIPDMPVAGVDEYFDREFYNAHYSEICRAYDALADDFSRRVFAKVIHFKLSGRLSYLEEAWSEVGEIYSLINKRRITTALDLGAYNGDTLREMKEHIPTLRSAIALEPDPKTFRRLVKYAEAEDAISVKPICAAAYSECSVGSFSSSGNRNSSIGATASYEHKCEEVSLVSADSLASSPDYIKYDVEGAELEALIGSKETIIRHAPALLVSVYHRSRDIYSLILYLAEQHPGYKLYLRRQRCVPAWELCVIALPEQ